MLQRKPNGLQRESAASEIRQHKTHKGYQVVGIIRAAFKVGVAVHHLHTKQQPEASHVFFVPCLLTIRPDDVHTICKVRRS